MKWIDATGAEVTGYGWDDLKGLRADELRGKEQVVDRLVVEVNGYVKGGSSVQTILESTNPQGIVLRSQNGKRWILQVSNTGSLSVLEIV